MWRRLTNAGKTVLDTQLHTLPTKWTNGREGGEEVAISGIFT